MEKLFDRLSDEQILLKIEKLHIDLGDISEKELLSGAFIEELIRQIEKEISNYHFEKPQLIQKKSIKRNQFDQWLYFLKFGNLPWQSALPDGNWQRMILDTLAMESVAVEQLRQLVSQEKTALKRMIMQYPPDFVTTIVELYTGHTQKRLIPFLEELKAIQIKLNTKQKNSLQLQPHQIEQHFFQMILKKTVIEKKKWDSKDLCIQYLIALKNDALLAFATHKKTQFKKEYPKLSEIILSADFKEKEPAKNNDLMKYEDHNNLDLQEQQATRPEPNPEPNQSITPKSTPEPKEDGKDLSKNELSDSTTPKAEYPQEQEHINSLDPNLPPTFEEPQQLPITEASAWYIFHSGMVLLHPFLSRFFEQLELMEDGKFSTEENQEKAVQLLHFLATGEKEFPEYHLTLAKVLCGVPLHQPISAKPLFSSEDTEEAEGLLEVMISHWEILGDTSIEGLREGFMFREGKLSKKEHGWYLQVEQSSIDILLDHLPWNLGMVMLPWMEEMLRVEWR